MLTVLTVLKSGGEYTPEWVYKLEKAVLRHLSVPHRFKCLSDVALQCETIALGHDWPGWWSKIEVFRPGVVTGPTLYLDLDTVLVGSIDRLADFPDDFAMMRNFNASWMPGSAVMWLRNAPEAVYARFKADPEGCMAQHNEARDGSYLGDQAFIWDTLHRKVTYLTDRVPGLIRSYRKHCMAGVPEGCALVAFGGKQKPSTVKDDWVKEHWNA